jgi:hypothetical protein
MLHMLNVMVVGYSDDDHGCKNVENIVPHSLCHCQVLASLLKAANFDFFSSNFIKILLHCFM